MTIDEYKIKYGKGWLRHWKRDKPTQQPEKYIKGRYERRKAHWNDFDYYRDEVKTLTNDNAQHIPNIHKRGFHSYHIDHKISIKHGYDNGYLAEHIAHHTNCEMLWWKDNVRKSDSCKIDDDNRWITE